MHRRLAALATLLAISREVQPVPILPRPSSSSLSGTTEDLSVILGSPAPPFAHKFKTVAAERDELWRLKSMYAENPQLQPGGIGDAQALKVKLARIERLYRKGARTKGVRPVRRAPRRKKVMQETSTDTTAASPDVHPGNERGAEPAIGPSSGPSAAGPTSAGPSGYAGGASQ